MTWRPDWEAIAGRIDALADASRFLLEELKFSDGSDGHSCLSACIVPEARSIAVELKRFQMSHRDELPAEALALLQKFLGDGNGIVPDAMAADDLAPIVWFQMFVSQFRYAIRNTEETVIALTDRAFQHLQRVIVADSHVRNRWQSAFREKRSEENCEKLGGAHLLHHGIFAFKIRGSGDAPGSAETTDLVYQEPIQDRAELNRIANGIVLTEWKRVDAKNIDEKTEEAIVQAGIYAGGVLGGAELRRVRYVVAVSWDFLSPPFERTERNITYKRIGIRVDPKPASETARRAS
jgi:hypothetical protein